MGSMDHVLDGVNWCQLANMIDLFVVDGDH